ncbi:type II toxin-antitoxin system RelE/ParE family toxin [Escherichia coli]|nr:type II toxin-antitoxin system RelE/ParE family toxin [Escherichia coli]
MIINKILNIFQIMSDYNIITLRPELRQYIFELPAEQHMVYFYQPGTHIIVRILSPHQDAGRCVN